MVDWFLKQGKMQFNAERRVYSTWCWKCWMSISGKSKKGTSISVHIHTCMWMFKGSFIYICPKLKKSKCLSPGKRRFKLWFIHTMEHDSATKRGRLLIYNEMAVSWRRRANERNQTAEVTYRMIPSLRLSGKGKSIGSETRSGGCHPQSGGGRVS